MALKRWIDIDRRWNKNLHSRLSPVIDEIFRPIIIIIIIIIYSSSNSSSSRPRSSLFKRLNNHILTGKCNTIQTIYIDIVKYKCQCRTRLMNTKKSKKNTIYRLGAYLRSFSCNRA